MQLHSDQGLNLVRGVSKSVCDLLNIDKIQTVAYHPMGNGAAERAVWNSIKMIAVMLADEDPLEWDLACSKATLAINTTPSTTMGQTPWLIKHSSCTEAVLPVNLMLSQLPEK